MRISTSMRWLVVVAGAIMLLAVVAACAGETVEVPGETVVVEKVVTETVEVPGETVVVEKEVIKTVEVPGETVTKEVVKTVEVPGETVVVEKEVVKTVEVPGETVVVEKVVVKEVPAGYVTDPTTGRTVTKPQYGGTFFTVGWTGPHADPWFTHHATDLIDGVNEQLGYADWGTPRDVYNFLGDFVPLEVTTGALAESWSQPDSLTTVFNIRQGVQWHDKAPMNGRELTAEDVAYSWNRTLGLGDFTEDGPSPTGMFSAMPVESVTATDKYTLVWKLSEPYLGVWWEVLHAYAFRVLPPEVIEEHGDQKDWRNVVGTGPFELTDWVEDSSRTFTKNPNYWGYDEKYPENRLPYFDEVRALDIPTIEARIAALRTGKLDGMVGMDRIDLDAANDLGKSNSELKMWGYSFRSSGGYNLNTKKPPFDDVRVRHAMQMALDYKALNRDYYGGLAVEGPMSVLGEGTGDFFTPFEEWPAELQGYYMYDLEGAEALLDVAGYPRDPKTGIRFETTYNSTRITDLNFIAIDYWADIGVIVNTQVHDGPTAIAMRQNADYDGMITGHMGVNYQPAGALFTLAHSDGAWNEPGYNDAEFDGLIEAMQAASTLVEQADYGKQASMRLAWLHGSLWFTKVPSFAVAQPWLRGYNGEYTMGPTYDEGTLISRLWIEHGMKAAMGY